MGSCLGGLLLVIIIFVVCYLKCFKDNQKDVLKEINDGEGSDRNFHNYWRPYTFSKKKNAGNVAPYKLL